MSRSSVSEGCPIRHDGKEAGHPEWIIFAFHLLSCLDFISRYSSTVICTVTIALLPHSFLPITINFNVFYKIKAMSIRELTWQIKQVVLEAQNFTSILPSLRISRLQTYEFSDLGQLRTRLVTKLQHHIDLQYDRLGTNFTQDLRQVL